MYKIDSLNSVDGHFSNGDYRTGRKGTLVPALWLNALQSEICNYITNSGIALDKNDNSQMLSALNKNLEKDLQKQTISENVPGVDSTGSVVDEFNVPPGGFIDFTATVTVATAVGASGTLDVRIERADDSAIFKRVLFYVDVNESGFLGRRRFCLKNVDDSLKTYKIKVKCSEGLAIVGSVAVNGWADYDAEVNNAQN